MMFERLSLLPPDMLLMRQLDDGLVIHGDPTMCGQVEAHFRRVYPARLPFTMEVTQASGRVPVLHNYLISLRPLHSTGYWKPTRGAAYVPWLENQPRQVRVGWIRAESIRYARISSHQGYF